MRSAFDRRVVSDEVLDIVRACQSRVSCTLGGGAALSGAHLAHRLSRDIDLVCRRAEDVRELVRTLAAIGDEQQASIETVRDAGTFVRARVKTRAHELELDVVHEATPGIESSETLEGVSLESLVDLRASKLTCILSRSEPRDLVDLLFLDRAGFPPEADLALALRKDAGVDPGVLAWLLGQFPLGPLPLMLVPFASAELATFRDGLRERLRSIAVPE